MKSKILFRGLSHRICQLALLALVLAAPLAGRAAATIWNGPVTLFSKAGGADPTQAVNQDRLTPNVWITRGGIQGLYNAKTESVFTQFFSPADTEWANGTTANYAALSYTDWNTWAKGVNPSPPSTVGVNAVLHLISDDIYLDIDFTSWSVSGGGFAYQRSTPTLVPEPAAGLLLLGGLAAVAGVRGLKRRSVEVAVPR
jgi:hypothetical protein